jgi:glutaminase
MGFARCTRRSFVARSAAVAAAVTAGAQLRSTTLAQEATPAGPDVGPVPEQVRTLLQAAHERFAANDEGENSQVYPALAAVPRDLFGICIAGTDGAVYGVGDDDVPFAIMSAAKPFVLAFVSEALGAEEVRAKVGVNATGFPFNSAVAIELNPEHLTNPLVNIGALATTSLAPGETAEEKWRFIQEGLSRFAGRPVSLNEEVYTSDSETNQRNRALANLAWSYDRLYFDPAATVDLYTRQSCLNVTARDLAVMGATLGNGGVQPLTGERIVGADVCQRTLAVMATAGLYETSGDWLYDVGLPGKSGIGGGIFAVAPGKWGIGTYAPPLDGAGNSVKGQLAAQYLSEHLGLNLFAPAAAPRSDTD